MGWEVTAGDPVGVNGERGGHAPGVSPLAIFGDPVGVRRGRWRVGARAGEPPALLLMVGRVALKNTEWPSLVGRL